MTPISLTFNMPKVCIQLTPAAAQVADFPLDRLIFIFSEDERVDPGQLNRIVVAYKAIGFATAIDDFGAGYAGLNLLARFQPDIVKLDMELVRDIDHTASSAC